MSLYSIIIVLVVMVAIWITLKLMAKTSKMLVTIYSIFSIIFIVLVIFTEVDFRNFVNGLEENNLYFYSKEGEIVLGYESFPYRSMEREELKGFNSIKDKKAWLEREANYILIFNENALLHKVPENTAISRDITAGDAINILNNESENQIFRTRLFFDITRTFGSDYFIEEYDQRNIDFYPRSPFIIAVDTFPKFSKFMFNFVKGGD